METDPTSIGNRLIGSALAAVVSLIAKGEWIQLPAWDQRIKIDVGVLRDIYAAVDMGRVRSLVKERIEERIADYILANMATEIQTDLKSILSNRELREDVRAMVRAKIRESADGVSK